MRTRGPYDCSWVLENIGSVFFYTCDFCISGLTTMQSLCCRIFIKSKGVILIEKWKNFITIFSKDSFSSFNGLASW